MRDIFKPFIQALLLAVRALLRWLEVSFLKLMAVMVPKISVVTPLMGEFVASQVNAVPSVFPRKPCSATGGSA